MTTHTSHTVDTLAELRNAQAREIEIAQAADGLAMPELAARCRRTAAWYGRQLRAAMQAESDAWRDTLRDVARWETDGGV